MFIYSYKTEQEKKRQREELPEKKTGKREMQYIHYKQT